MAIERDGVQEGTRAECRRTVQKELSTSVVARSGIAEPIARARRPRHVQMAPEFPPGAFLEQNLRLSEVSPECVPISARLQVLSERRRGNSAFYASNPNARHVRLCRM